MKPRGWSLVLVLSVMAGISAIIIAALVLTQLASKSSQRHHSKSLAEFTAHQALLHVTDTIRQGITVPYQNGKATASATACAGLIEVRDFTRPPWRDHHLRNSDAFASNSFFRQPFAQHYNPRWIPLFSYQHFAPRFEHLKKVGVGNSDMDDKNPHWNPTNSFNFNTRSNPFFPDEYYLGGHSTTTRALRWEGGKATASMKASEPSVDRPVWVQWIPVAIGTNQLVRYAYWVDVENTKVNLTALPSQPLNWKLWEGLLPQNSATTFDSWITSIPSSVADWQALPQVMASVPEHSQRDFRRAFALNTTLYGEEEDRDPLGLPKVNLYDFQNQPIGGEAWNELTRRASDKQYYSAYYLGNYANRNSPSYIETLNTLSSSSNGSAYLEQTLLNLYSAPRPHDEAPEDLPNIASLTAWKERGLFPAKSMPYVAEVATRARSAFFLIPNIEANPPRIEEFMVSHEGRLTLTNTSNYRNTGRDNLWYLTNAVIDVAVALANPNPFATNAFKGTLELHLQTEAQPSRTTLRAEINGIYPSVPLPSQAPNPIPSISVHGTPCVWTNIAVVPVSALKERPQFLKIHGWDIRDLQGKLFHTVPLVHPSVQADAEPLPWWRMAEQYAGEPTDENSLHDYHSNNIAVGWFTRRGFMTALNTDNLAQNKQLFTANPNIVNGATDSYSRDTVTSIIQGFRTNSVIERVQCIDPTLGHRTGGTDFYGAFGHAWRHAPVATYTPQRLSSLTQAFSNPANTTNWTQNTLAGLHLNDAELDGDVPRADFTPRTRTAFQARPRHSFFSSAPQGSSFQGLGDIGWVHSGMLQRPIDLTGVPTSGEKNSLGHPSIGIPKNIWLDWLTFNRTPSPTRVGTFNINTAVAHDSYLVLREGGSESLPYDHFLMNEKDPNALPAYLVWAPSGSLYEPKTEGVEEQRWDAWRSPLFHARRGWENVLTGLSGNTNNYASEGKGLFALGLPPMTWHAGNGISPADELGIRWGRETVLALGLAGEQEGFLYGNFSADQGLDNLNDQEPLPYQSVTRFQHFGLKHFLSEINGNNVPPSWRMENVPTSFNTWNGSAGTFAHEGIFLNAPLALSVQNASTSANAFRIHVVAQSLDSEGKVTAQHWLQAVLVREQVSNRNEVPPRYSYRIAEILKAP